MSLKIATMIAIAGTALHLCLALFQQMLFAYRPFGITTFQISRLVGLGDILLFSISLLVFFVAFLLSLRARPT